MESLKQVAKKLKQEIYAIYLASKDKRVPWNTRFIAAVVVACAFSPIDLIPDFVPIFGYLDDLILILLSVWLIIKILPNSVLAECRAIAKAGENKGKPKNGIAGGVIFIIWISLGILAAFCLKK